MIRSTTIMVLTLAIGLVMGSATGDSSSNVKYTVGDFASIGGVSATSTKDDLEKLFGEASRSTENEEAKIVGMVWESENEDNEAILTCDFENETGKLQYVTIACDKNKESVAEVLAFFDKNVLTKDPKITNFLGHSIKIAIKALGKPYDVQNGHYTYKTDKVSVDFIANHEDKDFVSEIVVSWL